MSRAVRAVSSARGGVSNLGGWLAKITYRRAIDDVRRAHIKYRAPVAVGEGISQLGYEHDVDAELADRQRYDGVLMTQCYTKATPALGERE